MQQIKGSVLRARLAFVEAQAGAEGVRRVLNGLSPEDRRVLEVILPVTWYPFDVGKHLDDTIVRVIGGGDERFFERLGEESAERNLTTVHKSFMTQGDPHAFLSKAPLIYSFYYHTGRRDYQRSGEREGVLTTYDAETFSAPDCLTVVGWYRRALELCGAGAVRVVEEECRAKGGAVCKYRVSWGSP